MRELALFAGAGGGILGGKILGWRTICAVERDAHCATILAQRQNEGLLKPFPIWSDIETFDGRPWRGIVDVISGGFPCNDISIAKWNFEGIDGKKSGLWGHMARVIVEVRPRFVFVENSSQLIQRGLIRVLGDLAQMGYDARWGVVSAENAGALHERERAWLVAHAGRFRRETWPEYTRPLTYLDESGTIGVPWTESRPEPALPRMAHGLAHRVERVIALGNGIVPSMVPLVWDHLTGEKHEYKIELPERPFRN